MSASKTFDMDYQKKLTLSPLEKYELYNKFPWQMILHTLLIIFTTIQVLCVLEQLTAQNRAQHMILKHILLNQDEDSDEVQYFSVQDFQNQMLTMIENLNNLDDVLFQKISIDDANFQFNVFYSSFDTNNANKTIFHVNVSEPILHPFDINSINSIQELIQTVQRIEFEGDQIQHLIKFRDIAGEESCINWKFKISYKFDKIGVIKTKIETSNSNCSIDNNKQSGQDFLLIHFIVLILGSISIITTVQYLYDLGSEYLYNKQMYKDIKSIIETEKLNENDQQDVIQQSPQMGVKFSQAWRNIDYQQDVKQFDNWYIVNALGGFFQVVGATIAILDQILTNDLSIYKFQVAMMGFGCFLAWLLLLQYLEYFQDISLVTWTLRKSSKNIVMFIISILPFFFGFVYLAQAIFWKYNYFETTIDTILSLFALSNGDILLGIYQFKVRMLQFSQTNRSIWVDIYYSVYDCIFHCCLKCAHSYYYGRI